MIFKLILESVRFSWSALTHNVLRTILSLAGVTIGIFLIIGVLTAVDSLERSINDSFKFLGANVIYIQKWPWSTSPDYPWWKYINRPIPGQKDYQVLREECESLEGITIFASRSGMTAKYKSSSISGLALTGVSEGYPDVYEVELTQGRYFSPQELALGKTVAIIGANTVKTLFPDEDPIGKQIKVRGAKFNVIGVFKEEGETLISVNQSNDETIMVPLNNLKRMFYMGRNRGLGAVIAVKGLKSDPGMENLENEIRGTLRKQHGLRPNQDDDFAINRPEMIANQIGQVFTILTLAGWVIGGFSILVGAFGIANIMFVSVNERTSIIGIQKSLGAKRYFILLQFLFESVFLSLIGGVFGLFIVYLLTLIPLEFTFFLSLKNIIIGASVSLIVGVLAGIIPANMAARLDPVIAIRAN